MSLGSGKITCKHCGEKKLADDFYRDRKLTEGKRWICAECYVEWLIEIGAEQNIIEYVAECNGIELQQKLFLGGQ